MIEKIIKEAQNKRHNNHVSAGKKNKEKWYNQGYADAMKETKTQITKIKTLVKSGEWVLSKNIQAFQVTTLDMLEDDLRL